MSPQVEYYHTDRDLGDWLAMVGRLRRACMCKQITVMIQRGTPLLLGNLAAFLGGSDFTSLWISSISLGTVAISESGHVIEDPILALFRLYLGFGT